MKRTDIIDRVLSLEQLPVRPETAAHLLAFHHELADGYRLRRLLAADPALLSLAARTITGPPAVPTIDQLATVARSPTFWYTLAREIRVLRLSRDQHQPVVRAWRFGLATACSARALAQTRSHQLASSAYVAGWYRTLGAYVYAILEPDAWGELRARATSYEHLLELERDVFGLTQLELSIHLLTHWGLSVEPLVELRRAQNGNGSAEPLARLTADAVRVVEQGRFALCGSPLPMATGEQQSDALNRSVAQVEHFLAEARRSRGTDQGDWLLSGARLAAEAVAGRCVAICRRRLEPLLTARPTDFPAAFSHGAADALRAVVDADAVVCICLPSERLSWVAVARRAQPIRHRRLTSLIDNFASLRAALPTAGLPVAGPHGWLERVLLERADCVVLALVDRAAQPQAALLEAACQEVTLVVERGLQQYTAERQRRDVLCRLHETQAGIQRLTERRVLEAIGQFAAGAAHELNNRIAVIRGRAQLLIESETDQQRAAALQQILNETRRVREILQKLYDIADPADPEYERVPVEDIVTQAIRRVCRELQISEHRIATHWQETDLWVQADPEMLREALYELFRNAVEASDEEAQVQVQVRPTPQNAVLIRIMDRGPGMDERLQRLAWIPFFSGRDAGRGTGLGLPLAKRFVEAQGGRLRLYSCGSGTVVDIILPVPPAAGSGRRCA